MNTIELIILALVSIIVGCQVGQILCMRDINKNIVALEKLIYRYKTWH
jgi:hypothetical protein